MSPLDATKAEPTPAPATMAVNGISHLLAVSLIIVVSGIDVHCDDCPNLLEVTDSFLQKIVWPTSRDVVRSGVTTRYERRKRRDATFLQKGMPCGYHLLEK